MSQNTELKSGERKKWTRPELQILDIAALTAFTPGLFKLMSHS